MRLQLGNIEVFIPPSKKRKEKNLRHSKTAGKKKEKGNGNKVSNGINGMKSLWTK